MYIDLNLPAIQNGKVPAHQNLASSLIFIYMTGLNQFLIYIFIIIIGLICGMLEEGTDY